MMMVTITAREAAMPKIAAVFEGSLKLVAVLPSSGAPGVFALPLVWRPPGAPEVPPPAWPPGAPEDSLTFAALPPSALPEGDTLGPGKPLLLR